MDEKKPNEERIKRNGASDVRGNVVDSSRVKVIYKKKKTKLEQVKSEEKREG